MTLTTRLLCWLLPTCHETALTNHLRYHLRSRTTSATSGRPFARHWNGPGTLHHDESTLLSRSGQALPQSSESRIPPEQVPAFVETAVASWANKQVVRRRLQSFGIPDGDLRRLLKEFVRAVRLGRFSDEEAFNRYGMNRFTAPFPLSGKSEHVDRIFTNVFYAWACDPEIRPSLEKLVRPSTISGMLQLQEAADMTYPADSFVAARAMRRKVIMHVGPTNSGKTHNALRALAAARSGLYAGPLRLLAHEVWKRLNQGQIVPLGVDPEPDSTSDGDVALDLLDESKNAAPTVRKDGNPKYARPCNLLTGEMAKIVAPEAPLLSATVEMTSFKTSYDVAVVDEIQMVADPERGGAWTNAVLGLCAKELHLCGEESAVPLVEEMLKETGDELTVHRYQRLTPLVVEDQSLRGDLSLVRKGDCIVAFTRTRIFALKRLVERTTGLRCAVAYGRLPPEVRSDQAALFNDPGSGYDVMIGSDALGMGLNLCVFFHLTLSHLNVLKENQTHHL
jgi:ATP-dependent RNA helicase SUPV3L1/SUV3